MSHPLSIAEALPDNLQFSSATGSRAMQNIDGLVTPRLDSTSMPGRQSIRNLHQSSSMSIDGASIGRQGSQKLGDTGTSAGLITQSLPKSLSEIDQSIASKGKITPVRQASQHSDIGANSGVFPSQPSFDDHLVGFPPSRLSSQDPYFPQLDGGITEAQPKLARFFKPEVDLIPLRPRVASPVAPPFSQPYFNGLQKSSNGWIEKFRPSDQELLDAFNSLSQSRNQVYYDNQYKKSYITKDDFRKIFEDEIRWKSLENAVGKKGKLNVRKIYNDRVEYYWKHNPKPGVV